MGFYVCHPDEDGPPLPKGRLIRFKTLQEVRAYLKLHRRAFRIHFHDIGEYTAAQAIEYEELAGKYACDRNV